MCRCIVTAQVISPRNATVEARVRSRGLPCGICEVQSGSRAGFFCVLPISTVNYHSILPQYSYSCTIEIILSIY